MFKRAVIFLVILLNISHLWGSDILWETVLPGRVISHPIERRNSEVIVICEDRRVYSINTVNGSINWKIKPGGRLLNLKLSYDGSIIVISTQGLFSLFPNGTIRWRVDLDDDYSDFLKLDKLGQIGIRRGNTFYVYNRFGKKLADYPIVGNNASFLSNALILIERETQLDAITFSGLKAWSINFSGDLVDSVVYSGYFYLIFRDGKVLEYSDSGALKKEYHTNNSNITSVYKNMDSIISFQGDLGLTTLVDGKFVTEDIEGALLFSNGILLKTMENWSIVGVRTDKDSHFFPSGKRQLLDQEISLSNLNIWMDEKLEDYYIKIILDGNRDLQTELLDRIERSIDDIKLLDNFPNFYSIMLLAASTLNPNSEIRDRTYRLMGRSKNLLFLPFIYNNLKSENSFLIIPSMFSALAQIGVDPDGRVLDLIVSRMDDYYDEKLVLEALYALYYINRYTGGDNISLVFAGIEKVLNGGYSQRVESECFKVMELIKKVES